MIKGVTALFIVLLFVNTISAFAVSSAYWRDNPLRLKQGETFDFKIVLQNPSAETDSLKANILSGSEIIQITDKSNIYEVPAGEKTNVNLKAIVPENAKVGQIYPINIELITVQESSSGEFGFGTAIGQNFNIIVTREDGTTTFLSKNTMTLLTILTIGIFILGLIIIFLIKKRTQTRK